MKNRNKQIGLVFYFVSIFAFTYFAFFTYGRNWGVNAWGYFSTPLVLSLFAFFSISGIAIFLWNEKIISGYSLRGNSLKTTLWSISLLTLFFFFFLRVKSYFLGDGYTILSLISKGSALIEKKRQLLESYSHIYLYNILGSNGINDAILSYQIISISAGMLFIAFVIYSSLKLFDDLTHRVLFILGLLSSGYMLLYFGYVEHYSLFSLSILIFCTFGLLILQHKVSKWILILLVPLSISLHIFGVATILPALYLIYKDGKLENLINKIKNIYIYLFSTAALVVLISVFWHFYQNDYFFQLSLVPLYMTRLTQEGYTIFSFKHLIDYFNLLFLLIPGILILVINFFFIPIKALFKQQEYIFLGLLTLSSLGITFIFDPKLGMARDWDLFAFSGIPLAFLLYYILLKQTNFKYSTSNILLSILLGYCVLIPRAYSLTQDDISIKHFKNYIILDKIKNRNSWILLVNYYKDKGDSTKSDIVFKEWKSKFPEEVLMKKANDIYYKEKNLQKTIDMLYKILNMNPTYSDAYAFLGSCYINKQQFDSAITLLRMSDALSPNRAHNLDNLGRAYHHKKDYDNALINYLKSTSLDSTSFIYQYNLGRLYLDIKDFEKYHQQMLISASKPDAVDQIYKELILSHLNRNEYKKAEKIISTRETIKNDSLFMRQINSRYKLDL